MDLAVAHLRYAVEQQPYDSPAARALYLALLDTGAKEEADRLAQQRRCLRQAAPELLPGEEWLPALAPAGDALVSVVVVCCNQLDYTRFCLESVLGSTRAPYELVLVDNGARDGTAAYLEEIKQRPGPERVLVLSNPENVGFPWACNQGWRHAQGRIVVFLRNDTVVTEGWLEGLFTAALAESAASRCIPACSAPPSSPAASASASSAGSSARES
jgi:Glycosyl transferase family 2